MASAAVPSYDGVGVGTAGVLPSDSPSPDGLEYAADVRAAGAATQAAATTVDEDGVEGHDDDDDEDEDDEGEDGKRKHTGDAEGGGKKRRLQRANVGDKNNKGLRHFSMKVCNKVEEKMRTTYNEVADELVAEFVPNGMPPPEAMGGPKAAYDEKNIRRRVYDALNVLMAMDIIAKEKKNITWRGLPTNARQEAEKLQADAEQRRERIEAKRLQLQELLTQQISFKHLLARNRSAPFAGEHSRVQLPFIIVNTSRQTVIDCEMAEDKRDIFFNFSMPFEIHDDNEILKRMGMHQCQLGDLPHLVPPALIPFTPQYQEAQHRALSNVAASTAAQPQPPPARQGEGEEAADPAQDAREPSQSRTEAGADHQS